MWQIATVAVLVCAGSHSVYACNPSYANGISNDDMYVYAETNILDPDGNVIADVILYDPLGNRYELDGSLAAGDETTNLQQGINGMGGTWTNEGVTYDGPEYVPAQAPTNIPSPYVQITGNSMSPTTISISGANQVPTCGTDNVTVAIWRGGLDYPQLTVSFTQSAGLGQVTVPANQTVNATTSPTHVAPMNGVCATNAGAGNIVRAVLTTPLSNGYAIKDPSPAGNADSNSFTVTQ